MSFLRRYVVSIVIAVLIWVVCMVPVPETPLSRISFIDKWTHFVMYATFTVSMLVEYYSGEGRKLRSQESQELGEGIELRRTVDVRFVICGIAVLMGCLVELAQAYLTTCRSGDWFDALCNTLGVMLGMLFFSVVRGVVKR